MQTETILSIILLLFLWLLSAWDALVHFSGGRVRRIESKDHDMAKKMEQWLDDKHAYEAVFRLLVMICIAFIAIMTFNFIDKHFEGLTLVENIIYAVIATFASVVIGEILNESLIARFDLPLLRITMPLIKILRYSIFLPVVFCTETLRDKIEKWQSLEDDEERATTEDEILSLVEQDETEGEEASLEEDEKRMIRGVFDLDNTDVREIMTPRVDIIGIEQNENVEAVIKLFIESGLSRIPVYVGSVDNIQGILYAKDFLNKSNLEGKNLMQLARKPIFIPETKEVGDLLEEIQKTRNHFAVIIDEYGGTSGIVSLEDIIEEIVGEIRDEYDMNEADDPMHVEMPDGSVVFDARTLIDDVNDIMDSHIPEDEDVDTIGGYICGELGHIPKPDEELSVDEEQFNIKVLKSDRKRIIKVKISKLDKD